MKRAQPTAFATRLGAFLHLTTLGKAHATALCLIPMALAIPGWTAQTVTPIRGNYCTAMGPQGWFVRAENAQRVAFGADLNSGDGLLGASYSIFSAGRLNVVPGSETPDRAVAATLTRFGQVQTRFGNRVQLAANVF